VGEKMERFLVDAWSEAAPQVGERNIVLAGNRQEAEQLTRRHIRCKVGKEEEMVYKYMVTPIDSIPVLTEVDVEDEEPQYMR
jgi:hypothetical protein